MYECGADELDCIEKKFNCSVSVSKEKHNALQFTYYYSISWALVVGRELNLEIECGINNGTELVNYSFDGTLEPTSRTILVVKDIILDDSQYENDSFLKKKSQAILRRDKHLIFEHIRKDSYDNYVTGGNSKLEPTGLWTKLHLEFIYEEIDVQPNITF